MISDDSPRICAEVAAAGDASGPAKAPRRLPTNPFEVKKINDAARVPDAPEGTDLWTLEELGNCYDEYHYPIPTLVSPRAGSPFPEGAVTQDLYDKKFKDAYPIISGLLAKRISNFVIAGGAAGRPMSSRLQFTDIPGLGSKKPGDVDGFIVGISDEQEFLQKVSEVREAFIAAVWEFEMREQATVEADRIKVGSLVQEMIPGLFTMKLQLLHHRRMTILKFQVIMRAYASVTALLHAFDLGSSCIAYDGVTTSLTTMGAYAHKFKVNLMWPDYRSTTMESRLFKYFDRGFSLGLPHLDVEACGAAPAEIGLPHIKISLQSVDGNRLVGSFIPVGSKMRSDYESSDRTEIETSWYNTYNEVGRKVFANNVAQLTGTDPPRFKIVRCSPFKFTAVDTVPSPAAPWQIRLPFETGVVGPDNRTAAGVVGRDKLVRFLDGIISRTIHTRPSMSMKFQPLVKYLNMEPDQISRLFNKIVAVATENPGVQINLAPALEPFKEKVLARYDEIADKKIKWVMMKQPGRQWTASLNPRMEDPAEWYGSHYNKDPVVAPESRGGARPRLPPPSLQAA